MTSCKPLSEAPSCSAGPSHVESGHDSADSFASDDSFVDLYAVVEGRARIKPIKEDKEPTRRHSSEETRHGRRKSRQDRDHNNDAQVDDTGHGRGDGQASGQRRRSDRVLSSIPSDRHVQVMDRKVSSERKLTSDPSRQSLPDRQSTSHNRRHDETDQQQHRPSRPANERQLSDKDRARRPPERQESADSDRRRPSNTTERQSSIKENSTPSSNERNGRLEQSSDMTRRVDSKRGGSGELVGHEISQGRLQGHSRVSGKEETRTERPEPPKVIRRAPGGGDLMLSRQSSHGRLQGHGIVTRESRPRPPSDLPRTEAPKVNRRAPGGGDLMLSRQSSHGRLQGQGIVAREARPRPPSDIARPIEEEKPFVRMSRRRSMGDITSAERIQVQHSSEPEPQPRRSVPTKNRPDSPPTADQHQRPPVRMQRRGSMGDVSATPVQHSPEVLGGESRGRMPRRGSNNGGADVCGGVDRVRPRTSSRPPEPSCLVENTPERPAGRMLRRNSTSTVSQNYVNNMSPSTRR